ncbi:carbohydrate kinase [Bacillus sp. LL01]|uniref:PfkB family carbohydrate kinase n=1 Tax=Bacillus sp. LL01 TaxID=1665556 RepID=UPI00064D4A32|nr:PfkB family carbohydrate kinase [Bacillus sp. LL01]KMJ56234.1 carbohydrate kinase [Bacillus sp. LL01]
MNLIAIGDNVVDCYLDQEKYYPGGNCVNVAVNAKRNGAENVAYIGIFGTDEKAEHIKYALNKESIDFKAARTAEGISGQPQVSLTTEGDRVFIGGPKNTVQHLLKLQLTDEDLDFISDYDLCHVSCYSSMESELPKLSKVIDISYDFSNNLDLEYVELVAKHIKHAFFSVAELTDEELKQFMDEIKVFNFEVVALTRGSLPALFIKGDYIYEQNLQPIKVVDTMGAGDSLIAGFLVNYISGENMRVSLERATHSAENTCKIYGGFGYPREF